MNYDRIYAYRFQDIQQEQRQNVWAEITRFIEARLNDPKTIRDPAAGWCEFINESAAAEKWAIMVNNNRRFAHFPPNLLKTLDGGFAKSTPSSSQFIEYKGLIEITEPRVIMLNSDNNLERYLLFIYIIPVLLLLWYIITYSVNVPYWDQWSLIATFNEYASGDIKFSDFFRQHNEHRIFFPRIIFTTLAFASKWNTIIELCFSVFLAILSFLAIYKMSEINNNKNKRSFHIINIITCILIFSLGQYENFIWGFQIAWVLVNIMLIASVFILHALKSWSINLRQFVSSLCCLIASFSMAHGLVSWIAIIPSLISIENKIRYKILRASISIFLFFLSFIVYNIDYQKPQTHPDILFILRQPIDTITYFLAIIGAPIGDSVSHSIISGAIIFISFLFFNIYMLRKNQSEFAREVAPWLSIGWFAILAALLTTVGRAGFGVDSAMSSRYTTPLLLLIVSCLQMGRLWIDDRRQWEKKKKHQIVGFGFLAVILMMFFVSKSADAISQGHKLMIRKTIGQTCLEVIHFIDKSTDESSNTCLRYLFPLGAAVRSRAIYLEKLGFRTFPKDLKFVIDPIETHGSIDRPLTTEQPLTLTKRDQIQLIGWAVLPKRRQLPKTVFLSYGEHLSFFAHGTVYLDRPDVAKTLNSSRYTKVGWKANSLLHTIPIGETVIKAWVYDREGKQFVKLKGAPKIKVVE